MSYTDDYIIQAMNSEEVRKYYEEHPEQTLSEEMMEQRAKDLEQEQRDKDRAKYYKEHYGEIMDGRRLELINCSYEKYERMITGNGRKEYLKTKRKMREQSI